MQVIFCFKKIFPHTFKFYLGHGCYRNQVKVGVFEGAEKKMDEKNVEKEVDVYTQDESFGEVLISTTGKLCTVDEVIWEILESGDQRAVTEDTIFWFLFDMCKYVDVKECERYRYFDQGS